MKNKMTKKVYRNNVGEWFPYDKTDSLLLKCCEKHNKKLRDAITFVEKAKNLDLSPIQTNLIGDYFTLKSHSKFFGEWCEYHNKIHHSIRLENRKNNEGESK